MRHLRIAIIGAGSVVFTKTLIRDILAGPVTDIEFVLMAPSTRRTALLKGWADALIEANGLPATVQVSTDQGAAIEGSHYVITTFQVGGLRATELDYEIPMKYGVDQCIGDTLGPGGVFRALRHIPVARSDRGRTWRSSAPGRVAAQLRQPDGHGLLGPGCDRRSSSSASATGCRPRWT